MLLFQANPCNSCLNSLWVFQQVRALKQIVSDTEATTVTEVNQGTSTGNFIDNFFVDS